MNQKQIFLAGAIVAASFHSAAVLAADPADSATNKADSMQVVPNRSDLKPGAAPDMKQMDDNAQRQHAPDRATSGQGASTDGAEASPTQPGSADAAAASTADRDRANPDTNGDNLVTPEEMEKFLERQRSSGAVKN